MNTFLRKIWITCILVSSMILMSNVSISQDYDDDIYYIPSEKTELSNDKETDIQSQKYARENNKKRDFSKAQRDYLQMLSKNKENTKTQKKELDEESWVYQTEGLQLKNDREKALSFQNREYVRSNNHNNQYDNEQGNVTIIVQTPPRYYRNYSSSFWFDWFWNDSFFYDDYDYAYLTHYRYYRPYHYNYYHGYWNRPYYHNYGYYGSYGYGYNYWSHYHSPYYSPYYHSYYPYSSYYSYGYPYYYPYYTNRYRRPYNYQKRPDNYIGRNSTHIGRENGRSGQEYITNRYSREETVRRRGDRERYSNNLAYTQRRTQTGVTRRDSNRRGAYTNGSSSYSRTSTFPNRRNNTEQISSPRRGSQVYTRPVSEYKRTRKDFSNEYSTSTRRDSRVVYDSKSYRRNRTTSSNNTYRRQNSTPARVNYQRNNTPRRSSSPTPTEYRKNSTSRRSATMNNASRRPYSEQSGRRTRSVR